MPTDELLEFLGTRDAAYCFRGLATAFPHVPVRSHLEDTQRGGAPIIISDGRCAICTLTTAVVAYVPESPELTKLIRPI